LGSKETENLPLSQLIEQLRIESRAPDQ
jgi:hypothetical protein